MELAAALKFLAGRSRAADSEAGAAEARVEQREEGAGDVFSAELTLRLLPVVRQVINRKLRSEVIARSGAGQDAEDICQDVLLTLLSRLQRDTAHATNAAVREPESYIRRVAENAYNDYMRRKYPQRRRLTKSLHYLFAVTPALSIWRDSATGETVCGLKGWEGRPVLSDAEAERLCGGVIDNPPRVGSSLHQIVAMILEPAGRPLAFKHLASCVAEVKGVKDTPAAGLDEKTDYAGDRAPDAFSLDSLDRRRTLLRLWDEIREMSLDQRQVLLLGLRDVGHGDMVSAFVNSGVASVDGLASALGLGAEEFDRLWDELPLSDAEIAARLNKTKLQISNIRNAIRKRLERRMRATG